MLIREFFSWVSDLVVLDVSSPVLSGINDMKPDYSNMEEVDASRNLDHLGAMLQHEEGPLKLVLKEVLTNGKRLKVEIGFSLEKDDFRGISYPK